MNINLVMTPNVTVNYDTFNELYIVIDSDGTTNCSNSEVLLHTYQDNVVVCEAITEHQNMLKLFQ